MKEVGPAVMDMIKQDLQEDGVTDMTAEFGERLVEQERCSYLRPVVVHASSPSAGVADKEYMFPFVSVVECPQEKMIKESGYTLVGTAITDDENGIDQIAGRRRPD